MTYDPFQMRDAQQQLMPFLSSDDSSWYSYGGTPNIVFIGAAVPNIALDVAGWKLLKITYDAKGNIVRVRQATTGTNTFVLRDHVIDNSVGVTITAISKALIAEVQTDIDHDYSTGDRIEIIGSDATEANGDGYGSIMYKIKVTGVKKFTLVDVNTDLDVDSSGWAAAGTSGTVYKRSYGNCDYT